MIADYFRGIWQDRYILFSLINKDLQLKYRRSKLGVLWSILTPLGLVLIIGLVYSIIFRVDPKVFIPTLFAGLTPWTFFSGCAGASTTAFLSAEGYLKQTTVNAQIFPLRTVLVSFVDFLYSTATFVVVYLLLRPNAFGPTMLAAIPGMVLLFFFTLGFANLSAILNLYVRDWAPLQGLLLQMLFYVTPIIYSESTLAMQGFSFIYEVNPIYYIINIVRKPLLGQLPPWWHYLVALAMTVVLLLASIGWVQKNKKKIVFKL